MEEKESDALEMGKEKKKAHQEKAEAPRRRAVACPDKTFSFSSILFFFCFNISSLCSIR